MWRSFRHRHTTIPDVLVAVGTVHAAESAQISAQMMGNVMAVNVREGDAVKQGQVLVAIDSAQAQATLERAQAATHRGSARSGRCAKPEDSGRLDAAALRHIVPKEVRQSAGIR